MATNFIIDEKQIKIKLTSKMLGTVPKNKEIYAAYVANKASELAKNTSQNAAIIVEEKAAEEVETVDQIEEKGWTGFHSDKNGLFIYEYMIKGFLKAAVEVLIANQAIVKVPAYKKWIDRMVFIEPRRLYFNIKKPDGTLERPLRTMTAKGERVAIMRSDYIEAGRKLTFTLKVFKHPKLKMDILTSAFAYGQFVGLGQWRGSGGYGRFKVIK